MYRLNFQHQSGENKEITLKAGSDFLAWCLGNVDQFKLLIHLKKRNVGTTHPPTILSSTNAKHLRHRYLDRHFMTMLMVAHSWEQALAYSHLTWFLSSSVVALQCMFLHIVQYIFGLICNNLSALQYLCTFLFSEDVNKFVCV